MLVYQKHPKKKNHQEAVGSHSCNGRKLSAHYFNFCSTQRFHSHRILPAHEAWLIPKRQGKKKQDGPSHQRGERSSRAAKPTTTASLRADPAVALSPRSNVCQCRAVLCCSTDNEASGGALQIKPEDLIVMHFRTDSALLPNPTLPPGDAVSSSWRRHRYGSAFLPAL